ncbi:carboxypeptidase regulatory-like domain-containing protein [Actinoalloteichus hymeniacidonis]|uniref:Carboxypeptidase regulatory-like domain-containing protein n=1 Tax=Actinoalloteichus hymeniacidonis TaxID=340345 RepID=A0AAC9HVN5_9PSEU|nr:carboxypeptidase regulatory-like domain-containing protein [Actinoalloteichus hymeniacidonis]AOS65856.1 hypothetical protein TL08_25400 [Actinoalloteichus hymeniacidonis]MBB5906050.1 hypothetical protein [Actinoalloteichus hymeniacidonis]
MSPTGNGSGQPPGGEDVDSFDVGDVLLAELGLLLDSADPVPSDLVERAQFAIELENLDVEVGRWERPKELAGVRGGEPSTMTFTVGDLTLMLTLAPSGNGHRFDGWLVPGGPHLVEVRVAGYESSSISADEGGRFALDTVPRGTTQILVHLTAHEGRPSRTIATPSIVL